MTAPQINPGEIANWPLLKVVYRTDPDKIADLLPPGHRAGRGAARAREHLQRAGEGRARVRRVDQGRRQLRRHARLLRHRPRHRPGVGDLHQPGAQRPAQVPVLDRVLPSRRRGRGALHAPGLHVPRVPRPGHRCRRRRRPATTRSTTGGSSRRVPSAASRRATTSRRTSSTSRQRQQTVRKEIVDGTLVLRDSPWDPYTTVLPMREQVSSHLVWSASEEPRDHARRPARPDRVLAVRRHHRRLALARVHGRPAVRPLTVASPHAP